MVAVLEGSDARTPIDRRVRSDASVQVKSGFIFSVEMILCSNVSLRLLIYLPPIAFSEVPQSSPDPQSTSSLDL
jgi:hypothetical protein